jgi:hypothetical protein
MSKQGSEADDLRLKEVADAAQQEAEEDEAPPESGEVSIASETHSDVKKTVEKHKIGYDEAASRLLTITNAKTLRKLAKACHEADIVIVDFEPNGAYFEAKPVRGKTEEVSQQLADMLNEKRDELIKKPEPKQPKKAKRRRPKAKKPEREPTRIEKLIETIGAVKDFEAFEEIVTSLQRAKMILLTLDERGKWKVEAIEGVEGSKELVQAIESKRRELKAAERLHRILNGIEEDIGQARSDHDLEVYVWQELVQKLEIVNKINLDGGDWTVEPIEGKEGSEEVVKMVLSRKERLAAKAIDALVKQHNEKRGKK